MRHSQSQKRNARLVDWSSKYQKASNSEFFGDALAKLADDGVGHGGKMAIGLLGQRDIPGVLLRQAQSVLRWDLRPSLWSHSFLLSHNSKRIPSDAGKLPVTEVAFHSRTGRFPKPECNAIETVKLRVYDDPEIDANAAILVVDMTAKELRQVQDMAEIPNFDRERYNFWDMLGAWQMHLWSQGSTPNPLAEGVPIFSSAYVEMVYSTLGFDLTPGASSRNSAPEHLWNTAVWWHEALAHFGRSIHGYYVLRDRGCSVASTDD